MEEISGKDIGRRTKNADEKFKEYSKERLLTAIKQKFDTTIIGSLSIFENHFGFLWGHGLPVSKLNEQQLEYRQLWEEARKELLDAGHSNSRAAKTEISNYSLTWNRFVMKFTVKEPGNASQERI